MHLLLLAALAATPHLSQEQLHLQPEVLELGGPAAVLLAQAVAAPPALPADSGLEYRMSRRIQLQSEISDLQRRAEEAHFLSDYIVGVAVGGGLVGLGYLLDVVLNSVIGGAAGQIAGFWTFFGCALGGGITFAILMVTGTIQLVRFLIFESAVNKKIAEMQQLDEEEHQQKLKQQGPPPTGRGPSDLSPLASARLLTVARF